MYTLTVKLTGNKSAKFHYQVIDENGNVISDRNSNREYVACTSHGAFYFGRFDLIGKGDHGRSIKYRIARGEDQLPIARMTSAPEFFSDKTKSNFTNVVK